MPLKSRLLLTVKQVNTKKRNVVGLLCLIAGLFLGVFASKPLEAAGRNVLEAFGSQGQRVGYIGPGNADQGTFFLFDPQGGVQVQMGAYDSGSEKGQSLMGLHGRNGSLRFLVRLYGANDSPVMIMKDKTGDDKLIIGLEGNDEAPYIKYRNKKGQMVNLLKE